jgi:hypothetical protein
VKGVNWKTKKNNQYIACWLVEGDVFQMHANSVGASGERGREYGLL